MEKINVLFLCAGNSCRSQIAEAFLRKLGGEHFEVFSAGSVPKGIHPLTYQVMKEIGYDLAGQWPKGISEYQGKMDFEHVITVCNDDESNCPVFLSATAQQLHWPFEDPTIFEGSEEEKLNKFRQVRDAIRERIQDWVREGDRESKLESREL